MSFGRVALIVVGVLLASAVAGATPDGIDEYCPEKPGVDDDTEPGQQLAGVVGEQQSVVVRELEARGFNATLANATSATERAAIVDAELGRIDARIEGLESCREALADAREDGDIGDGEFSDRTAALAAVLDDLNGRLNRTERVAQEIPDPVREEYDIEITRFDGLRDRIDELMAFVEGFEHGFDRW